MAIRAAHRLLIPRTQRVPHSLTAKAGRLLLLLGALGLTLVGSVPARTTPSPQPTLPLPAQAAISGVLGRDDPRYHATAHGHGVQLTNPRHHLAVALTPAGVRLQHGGAHWGLTWQGYGYGAVPSPSPAVAPLARGNRVEYRRGAVTEWYVNGPRGLQQGFTLQAPPGSRTGAPLTLYLTLSGTLHARVEPGQTGLTLSSPDGVAVLAYRGLTAWDATGRALPARLQLQGHALRLQIEDAGARYPLVVDPFVEQAKLTASDGAADDFFGASVAISGDTVVVGADGDNSDQGSAYVFVKPGGGWATTSAFTAKLTASDGAADDFFGASVAISGDTVVVGADGDNSDQGSAYVFVKPGGGWATTSAFTAKLTASDGAADDFFGASVAISGDTVVVGADGDNSDQGSAYVFVKPGGGWATTSAFTAKLTASDGAADDFFGASVAISGDTVVVGADGDNSDQGSAYVFVKPGGGWATTSAFTAKLTASDGATNDSFGWSAAISGDTVVVGAHGDNSDQGSAYVFVKPGGGWATTSAFTAKLTASDGATNDSFGISVAISGDTVVVGAHGDTSGDNVPQGSAYVFVKPGGGWATTSAFTAKLTASDEAEFDWFGISAAISGDTVVVGAHGDNSDQGSAYVFGNPASTVALTVSGAGPGPALTNPVTVTYTVQGCSDKEIFLVVNAPAMGMPWSYLGALGWVPLPADLSAVTPYLSSGQADGVYSLYSDTAPVGTYELYLGCDFVSDGVLNIDAGGNVNGVYDHRVVTVQ